MNTFFGSVNLNMIVKSFVYGTDGYWHEISKERESKSFSEAGDNKTIFQMITPGRIQIWHTRVREKEKLFRK